MLCEENGMRPILIDLQSEDRNIPSELMTSSKHKFDSLHQALELSKKQSKLFEENGMTVIRRKIETSPFHPEAPSEFNQYVLSDGRHFESHVQLLLSDDHSFNLSEISRVGNGHLSKNIFKKLDTGSFIQMITFRTYTGVKEDFDLKINNLCDYYEKLGLVLVKRPKIEFAIFDTNSQHDKNWLKTVYNEQ
jgi:hypothetical protein